MIRRFSLPMLIIALTVIPTRAQEAAAEKPQARRERMTFSERSPLSSIEEMSRRCGWPLQLAKERPENSYRIADESFELYVPASYKAEDNWGVLVFVSPGGNGGDMANRYADLLEKHKLIWIGPNQIGNNRANPPRIGLPVDAVHNVKKLYKIDDKRVYITGVSGGGRISSIVTIAYPDVFTGGIYQVGTNYFRRISAPHSDGKYYTIAANAPPTNLLVQAKKNVRHVLLTGDNDPNREQTQVFFEQGFKHDGFEQVIYVQIPNMGHQPASSEWFDRCLTYLDTGTIEANPAVTVNTPKQEPVKSATGRKAPSEGSGGADASAALAAAKALAAKDVVAGHAALQDLARKFNSAPEATLALRAADDLLKDPPTRKKIEDASQADRLMRVAKIYIDNRKFGDAQNRLEQIMRDFPDSPAAPAAKEMLKEVKKKTGE